MTTQKRLSTMTSFVIKSTTTDYITTGKGKGLGLMRIKSISNR